MNKMTNFLGKRSYRPQQFLSSSSGLSLVLENEACKGVLLTTVERIAEESNRSDMEQSLRHIFAVPSDFPGHFTMGDHVNVENLRLFLQSRLRGLSPATEDSPLCDLESRFGEAVVAMDDSTACGELKSTKGGRIIESQAIFSSVRANACVLRGKWMYEVILETAGIMQLGWATRTCSFTREAGVGDSNDSYAYDGRRVRKWNLTYHSYGEPWVIGDVIGCCIDLDSHQISFFRNGHSLGIAFDGVGGADSKLPYFPAISLSQGERCELNMGGRPFKYPVKGFKAIQAPPVLTDEGSTYFSIARAKFLFGCLQRLLQLDSHVVVAAMAPIERLKRLKPLTQDSFLVGNEICKQLLPFLSDGFKDLKNVDEIFSVPAVEYIIWGALVPFLIDIHRVEPPHDGSSVDKALDYLLSSWEKEDGEKCIVQIMEALAFGCRTTPVCLAECPYTGSYPCVALACHLLQREEIITVWWGSKGVELCLEGLLARKGTNKYDLEALMPTVWWPGSREDICSESIMRQTVTALAKAVGKVEEMQWELCKRLLEFVPSNSTADSSSKSTQHPEPVFQTFLKYLVKKNMGAARNMPPPGLSDNSVLMTTYTVLLRLLSEGWDGCNGMSNTNSGKEGSNSFGFLHRGGHRKFKVKLFLDPDTDANDFARLGGTFSHLCKTHIPDEQDYTDVEWEEGCMDDVENRIVHDGDQRPCCCSSLISSSITNGKGAARVLGKSFNIHFNGVYANEGSTPATTSDYSRRICSEQVEDKPSSSGRESVAFGALPSPHLKASGYKVVPPSDSVCEEELLDKMVLLYHLGVAPNFKQASYYLQHQLQSIAQLEDTDRQIRAEKSSSDFLKRLKEARAECKEDLVDCIRQSTWYRISLFSKWKQRGMYATCIWIVQLLLVLSKKDVHFIYVPEYYVETLLDCFHALRRSDPPFVSPTNLLQHGLASLVTFLATHFHDTRIANSDIRDVLLQSISVLVQYKEHVVAFECNRSAVDIMPGALLSSFDNRFWIPVTNILLRLCKGSGFGASKSSTHGEPCSPLFQRLIRERCTMDDKLLSSFLNRLFNTLNWTVAEFSISLKEMQESNDQRQVFELQQRKCAIMFELSCNLERLLEFVTREMPQAFLCGPEMNLIRLCELLMFVLTHTTLSADAVVFDSIVRQHGQALEKVNRAMILAPLVGIVLNLAATQSSPMQHNLAKAIVDVNVSVAVTSFQYLLEFNWAATFKGDPSLARLSQLKEFLEQLKSEASVVMQEISDEELMSTKLVIRGDSTSEERNDLCSICYACEVNTMFFPCRHKSCWRCISRHLLNNQRCFFCNTAVQDFCYLSAILDDASDSHGSSATGGILLESGLPVKTDCSL